MAGHPLTLLVVWGLVVVFPFNPQVKLLAGDLKTDSPVVLLDQVCFGIWPNVAAWLIRTSLLGNLLPNLWQRNLSPRCFMSFSPGPKSWLPLARSFGRFPPDLWRKTTRFP